MSGAHLDEIEAAAHSVWRRLLAAQHLVWFDIRDKAASLVGFIGSVVQKGLSHVAGNLWIILASSRRFNCVNSYLNNINHQPEIKRWVSANGKPAMRAW